jgi:hypothetical protein
MQIILWKKHTGKERMQHTTDLWSMKEEAEEGEQESRHSP